MKNLIIITGSLGLVGMETSIFFCKKNFKVLGIDNNMRSYFFGSSVLKNKKFLEETYKNYKHAFLDIRKKKKIETIFKEHAKKICLIIQDLSI